MKLIRKIKNNTKRAIIWIMATWLRRIIASVLIALFIVAPVSFLFTRHKAEAAWFDENWYYRKAVPITNNASEETNVYVSLTLDTSDTAKFQADCGDLRFTKYNGELLPYYVASGCGTAITSVYVAFDTFPAGQQTIYFYYGNPNAPNGFESAINGSVTQANMKLSIVNGIAFVDFSAANTLTPYLGQNLVISDSAGKKLTGYIKAAGTGETYGANQMNNNPGFEGTYSAGLAPNWTLVRGTVSEYTASPHGGTSAQQINNPASNSGFLYESSLSQTSGKLFKASVWYKALVGNGQFNWSDTTSIYSATLASSAWTQSILYKTVTITNGTSLGIYAEWASSANTNQIVYDDASVIEVLTPSATGATITSTSNGSTFSWVSEEGSFNRNDTTYSYSIYPLAFATVASNYTIGSLGLEEKSLAPVAYWSFDEGYGTTAHDETSNKNDGAFGASTAAPTWKPESECVSGKCLNFDGSNDYVQAAENKALPAYGNTNYTISGWVKGAGSQLSKTIFGEGKSTDTTSSGSVTQANMKMSIVSGTAFADFSSAGKLTPYIGNKIVITDSTGTHKLTGYIKAAGTGETYGSEVISDIGFDNAGLWATDDAARWSVGSSKATASSAYSNTSLYTDGAIQIVQNGLYKQQYDILTLTGGSVYWRVISTMSGPTQNSTGTKISYYNFNFSGWKQFAFQSGGGLSGTFDNYSVKQVLTPSTTGVTITDTAGGTNYNWTTEDSGFNRNDSGNYTYTIYPPSFTIGTDSSASGKLRVFVQNDNGTQPLGATGTLSTSTVFDNNWHHIEWVDSNGTTTLYVDGKADATNFNYTKGTATFDRTSIGAFLNSTICIKRSIRIC